MNPSRPRARSRTGRTDLDTSLEQLIDQISPPANADQITEILATGIRLGLDGIDRLDLKITNAALKEMRAAFLTFVPYEGVSKVTIFGSARTLPEDPLYEQTRNLASAMADEGWMIITGAGPGIMQAGMEGAGRAKSIGVSIRLPFESSANEIIAGDDKLISMKYFFTRKLMLMKESKGFVSLPGGFGTLDETMELLTLVQTGKASPAPIVLLDEPGGTFWSEFERFLRDDVAPRRLIDIEDLDLMLVTDDADAAVNELLTFVRNFHSLRWVNEVLVLRMEHGPSDEDLARLQ